MKRIYRSTPSATCIFCEDIRVEINTKHIYVGVFRGPEMIVFGDLPTNIGKFLIEVDYLQRPADGNDPVTIEVHLPGDEIDKPSARVEMPIIDIKAAMPPPHPENDDPIISARAVFAFNPLQIKGEGLIDVRLIRNDTWMRIGSLRVILKPLSEMPQFNSQV